MASENNIIIQSENMSSTISLTAKQSAKPLIELFNKTSLENVPNTWLLFGSPNPELIFSIDSENPHLLQKSYPDWVAYFLLKHLFDKCLKQPNSILPNEHYENIPDIIQIAAKKNTISIDSIKNIQKRCQYPPLILSHYIVLIPSCHQLNPSAANAFLKTLEEAPHPTFFLLSTDKKGLLLETIQSRCLNYYIKTTNQAPLSIDSTHFPPLHDFLAFTDFQKREWFCQHIQNKEIFEQLLIYWTIHLKDALEPKSKALLNLLIEKLNDLQYNVNLSLQLESFLINIKNL